MDNLKLYILVRGDISPEQQAVQAGHAVAQFCMEHPKAGWKNGTLVYLRLKDHDSIPFWQHVLVQLSDVKPRMGVWRDPDLYGTQEVALYVYGEDVERILRDLPLMRFK